MTLATRHAWPAVPLAHEAALLPWRIADAEQNLRQAEAAAAAEAAARGWAGLSNR